MYGTFQRKSEDGVGLFHNFFRDQAAQFIEDFLGRILFVYILVKKLHFKV
jgi:hypothetical protein